jgi:riboflavin transporter FmnP
MQTPGYYLPLGHTSFLSGHLNYYYSPQIPNYSKLYNLNYDSHMQLTKQMHMYKMSFNTLLIANIEKRW